MESKTSEDELTNNGNASDKGDQRRRTKNKNVEGGRFTSRTNLRFREGWREGRSLKDLGIRRGDSTALRYGGYDKEGRERLVALVCFWESLTRSLLLGLREREWPKCKALHKTQHTNLMDE